MNSKKITVFYPYVLLAIAPLLFLISEARADEQTMEKFRALVAKPVYSWNCSRSTLSECLKAGTSDLRSCQCLLLDLGDDESILRNIKNYCFKIPGGLQKVHCSLPETFVAARQFDGAAACMLTEGPCDADFKKIEKCGDYRLTVLAGRLCKEIPYPSGGPQGAQPASRSSGAR